MFVKRGRGENLNLDVKLIIFCVRFFVIKFEIILDSA